MIPSASWLVLEQMAYPIGTFAVIIAAASLCAFLTIASVVTPNNVSSLQLDWTFYRNLPFILQHWSLGIYTDAPDHRITVFTPVRASASTT